MSNFYHVTDGAIDDGPRTLPKSWRNVSGLHLLSGPELADLGWFPEIVVGYEPFDSATQVRTGPALSVGVDKVTATWTVSDLPTADLQVRRINETKAEAYRRIIEIIPEWKQRNLTARAVELLRVGEANWSQAQADEYAAGEAVWAAVKAVRTSSDTLETNIGGMTTDQLKALDVSAAEHWL